MRLAGEPVGVRVAERELGVPATIEVAWPRTADAATPKNPIVWVDDASALKKACQELLREPVIGLDVETSLDFGALCLVQLASPTRTFLVDALALGDLAPLAVLIEAAEPLKVIRNAAFERHILAAVGIGLDGVFDTLQESRKLRGRDALGGHSLAAVCRRKLGKTLSKTAQTSNWSRRPLTEHHAQYAALDAEILLEVHRTFVSARV